KDRFLVAYPFIPRTSVVTFRSHRHFSSNNSAPFDFTPHPLMNVVDDHLGNQLKSADGKCADPRSGDNVRDHDGIHGAEKAPGDALDETTGVCRSHTMYAAEGDDIPHAFVEVV